MRYPASEKLEIIRLVERSHLPAKATLDILGVARLTLDHPAADRRYGVGTLRAIAQRAGSTLH